MEETQLLYTNLSSAAALQKVDEDWIITASDTIFKHFTIPIVVTKGKHNVMWMDIPGLCHVSNIRTPIK